MLFFSVFFAFFIFDSLISLSSGFILQLGWGGCVLWYVIERYFSSFIHSYTSYKSGSMNGCDVM